MRIHPFCDGDTLATFRNLTNTIVAEIQNLENDYVLNPSFSELQNYYISRVSLTPLTLDAANHYIESQSGTQIDVSHDLRRVAFGRQRVVVKGTELCIAIPFTGDRSIRSLSDAVSNLARDVEKHNHDAMHAVQAAIDRRLATARAAVGVVAGLGIPIKQRSEPETFVAPTKRRDSPVSRPSVPRRKYAPEPILDQREYEYILNVLRSMALVIERSPASFTSLDEEAIRTHFLLQLNGHYEGSATAETFNAAGKTDILIRVDNRNVFIAECKFWRGPKSFSEAVDQLLGYLSWRDSKCALLIFNRAKDSSEIRQKMHACMTSRAEHRKTNAYSASGDARYTFVKASDPGREIQIHTMVFDIPQAT